MLLDICLMFVDVWAVNMIKALNIVWINGSELLCWNVLQYFAVIIYKSIHGAWI